VTGGRTWQQIQPGPDAKDLGAAANVRQVSRLGRSATTNAGLIYALAPSRKTAGRSGPAPTRAHPSTRDGGKDPGKRSRPKQLVSWAKVSILEAGQFDADTAYAAINTLRLDDLRAAHPAHPRRRQDLAGDSSAAFRKAGS